MPHQPTYFASPAEFRRWLIRRHASAAELLVGFHKKGTGTPSMTWPESVDEALCFGWIDGVRRRVDDERYTIRFTPRKPRSIWSAVNISRVAELTTRRLMKPAGLAAFARRTEKASRIYSYEQAGPGAFDAPQERRFRSSRGAWAFFEQQPPSYRKLCIHWVTTAKQEATRAKRLQQLIELSAAGRRR